jgi:hypothetical protein
VFIIVKHLDEGFTVDVLEHFVKPVLKGRLFQKTAELRSVKIVTLMDKEGMIIERHGLITIAPESEKARLIKALNNKTIGLEKFAVAEYVIRHWSNDRRASSHLIDSNPRTRRVFDRRRPSLRMLTLNHELNF